jgi:thymidylate synthase (FAD)
LTDITFRSDIVTRGRDSMGGDESIIEAMLVSSDKDHLVQEMLEIPKTEGRIRFLMRKRHGTPFEHNALKFYVEAPIFVFREWHRHRISWSYNEQSGRYSELPPMFYLPPRERPLLQVGKPGDYHYIPGDEELYIWLVNDMQYEARMQYASYKERLKRNIAKEVARMSLGVNIYSKMYATCNARSLMAFLSLRTNEPERSTYPSTPMWEIEAAARLTEDFFGTLFPITYKAFNDFGRVCP